MLRRRVLAGSVLGCALIFISSGLCAEPAPKTATQDQTQVAAPDRDDQDPADDEPERPSQKSRAVTPQQATATHQQVRIIRPQHDGKPVTLATFCLAANGNLLACVDTNRPDPAAVDSESGERKSGASFVQVYSPDGKLIEEIPVAFNATAINVGAKGVVFIAGEGKLAKIIDGKVAAVASTPHIGDYDEFKKKVVASAKEEMEEFCKDFKVQIKDIQKQIDAIESRGKQKELTKRDQAKLTSLKASLDMQNAQLKAFDRTADEDELVRERLVVTALGVTDRDVFVSVMSAEGQGYEVWRTSHNFEEPKKVVTQLSGCCGQLDIQARGDQLFVAENGKFEISVRNRDGKKLSSFGRRDRSAVDGFGSCCNPMNVRCCSNGDVLAAESSIGNIKRFNAQGEFVGLVGKAKIGIGCKHVALAFDESRNRYYMMNVDKAHIAVLVPLAEVPAETESEKATRQARDEISKRLAGRWARAGIDPVKKVKGAVAGLIGSIVGDDDDGGLNFNGDPFDQMTFAADGKLVVEGGVYSRYFDNDGTWEAVELDGKILEVAFLSGGAEFINARVEMTSDDELKIRVQNYGSEAFGEPITCRRDKNAKQVKPPKKSR